MKLSHLKEQLGKKPEANLRFRLPSGQTIPDHAHVTEVALINKRFVDCGGTLRSDTCCRLQTWVANDLHHRLTAAKLLKILDKAVSFLGSADLEVDVEHEVGYISQFPLKNAELTPEGFLLSLGTRHTACLAPEKCLPPPRAVSDFNPMKFVFHHPNHVPPSSGTPAPTG